MNLKNYKFIFTLFLVLFIAIGCEENTHSNKKESSQENNKSEVKEIILLDPPKNINSPSEAVTSQFKVVFRNGESKFPNKNSIIYESTLGKNSIIAIRSPEGLNRYAIFLYTNDSEWFIDGLIRIEFNEEYSNMDKEGIYLPMDKFNTSNIQLGDGKKVWVIINDETVVTIAMFNKYPFQNENIVKEVKLDNGVEAYIHRDSMGNPYLYYFDQGKIILISTNQGEQELIKIADSLPPSSYHTFPTY